MPWFQARWMCSKYAIRLILMQAHTHLLPLTQAVACLHTSSSDFDCLIKKTMKHHDEIHAQGAVNGSDVARCSQDTLWTERERVLLHGRTSLFPGSLRAFWLLWIHTPHPPSATVRILLSALPLLFPHDLRWWSISSYKSCKSDIRVLYSWPL